MENSDSAVSEVIGGILIVFVAVVVSISIYTQVLPVPIPSPEPNVHLMGYVIGDGAAIIQHMGGEILSSYEIHVYGSNGINDVYKYENDPWEIGTCIPILTGDNEIKITVYSIYDDSSRHVVFNGILKLGEMQDEVLPLIHPMLISTLRTDTTDEDLICYNYFIDVNASTYIYRWIVDGKPLTEILMPFDTESSTIAKDYSGNGYNGSIVGATWTEEGKVGGAYYFDGGSDYITVNSSPFDDVLYNDFTISVWIKSDAIADPFRRVLQVGNKTANNFVVIFQKDSKIHFGIYEDGEKRAVETETLAKNIWYHIAGVWDARKRSMAIYVNGSISIEPGHETLPMGFKSGFDIGHATTSSRFWLGFIDEVEIYNRALSAEQIYQIYLSTKDGDSDKRVVVSEETCLGDIWQCMVTPNDSTQDDIVIGSNILEIRTYG